MKIAAAAPMALAAALIAAGQAGAQSAPPVGKTVAGPLGYTVQRVLATRGMGDRHPVCAGPKAVFLVVFYTVDNAQGPPQPVAAIPHFVLAQGSGERLSPDKSALGDLSEALPERESPGPALAAGAGMEAVDVFVLDRARLAEPGLKLLAGGQAPAIDLAPPPLSPYAAPTCD